MRAREVAAPAWAPASSLGLALVGLALSTYLTIEHFTAADTLACPAGPTLNCVKVTTSEQSRLFGIPVAILGLAFFAAMVAICLPRAWREHSPAFARGRVVLAAAGVVFVVYLVYAELFLVDAICLWCTAVHAVALALFAVVALATAVGPPGR